MNVTDLKVRAVVTAQIGNQGWRQYPSKRVEAFRIDTAMDTDSDAFSVDLGWTDLSIAEMVNRNTEIRVDLFTKDQSGREILPLQLGLADIVNFDSDDNVLSLEGRDYSSVAVDSQVPPGEIRQARPDVIIRKEADALGLHKQRIAGVSAIPKLYRDGSESYWESWYRMMRMKKMWLWFEPDGFLIGDELNYSVSPTYFFGWPKRGSNASGWTPVERCTITKNNQARVGESWVFWKNGEIGDREVARDETIVNWVKRPRRIKFSSDATNAKEAREEAYEEIAEGKVGALEISIVMPYNGTLIRQNYMARLNIPSIGLSGLFYVVGVQIDGGEAGFTQTVRLRERDFALTKREPAEITNTDETFADPKVPGDIGSGLDAAAPDGLRWGNAFASAAKEFHGGWDYALFLAVLLAICDHETNFRNVRNGGDTEWYPRPAGTGDISGPPAPNSDSKLELWLNTFANNPGNPRIPVSSGQDSRARANGMAVGPMQLLTMSFKEQADSYGNRSDEYEGGRWMPEANIRAGAKAFSGKLAGFDPGTPEQIYGGVGNYYSATPSAARTAYMNDIQHRVEKVFMPIVQSVFDAAETVPIDSNAEAFTVNDDGGNSFTVRIPATAPDKIRGSTIFLLRQLGKPYEWGSQGPNSFDCSGLVHAAWAGEGINLIAHVASMWPQLTNAIPKDKLKLGDLIFFDNLEHMGVFVGSGHFLHAPHTGDVVKISSLNSSYYQSVWYGAKRVVNW